MNRIQQVIDGMDPEEALAAIAGAVKKLFALLSDEARLNFVVNLVGVSGDDKMASMVLL